MLFLQTLPVGHSENVLFVVEELLGIFLHVLTKL